MIYASPACASSRCNRGDHAAPQSTSTKSEDSIWASVGGAWASADRGPTATMLPKLVPLPPARAHVLLQCVAEFFLGGRSMQRGAEHGERAFGNADRIADFTNLIVILDRPLRFDDPRRAATSRSSALSLSKSDISATVTWLALDADFAMAALGDDLGHHRRRGRGRRAECALPGPGIRPQFAR